jgi:hypothetical protein
MPVYDQFETEPYVFYSGSMADNVMFGSIFSDLSSESRELVASKVGGISSASFYTKSMSRFEYNSVIDSISSPQKFYKTFSENEVDADGIPPSIVDVIAANNTPIGLLDGDLGAYSGSVLFGIPLGHGIRAGGTANGWLERPEIPVSSSHIFFSATGEKLNSGLSFINQFYSFVDNNWSGQYPYSSKFKLVVKAETKYRLNKKIEILQTLEQVPLSNPIKTDQFGSVNLCVPITSASNIDFVATLGGTTNIWSTSDYNIGSATVMSHVPNPMHAHFNCIVFNPFALNSQPSTNGVYFTLGEKGNVAESSDGITWKRNTTVSFLAPNAATQTPLNILNWPSTTIPNLIHATPVGCNGGKHWKWFIIAGNFDAGGLPDIVPQIGRLVVEKTSFGTPGKPEITINSEYEDKHGELSFYVGIPENDIDLAGSLVLRDTAGANPVVSSGRDSNDNICLFGRRKVDTTGNGEADTWKSTLIFTSKVADMADVNVNADLNNCMFTAAQKRVGSAIVWFIGTANVGALGPKKGIVGVLSSSVSPNASTAGFGDRTALAQAAWTSGGGTGDLPVLRALDVDLSSRTMLVGDNGLILRCTATTGANSVSWTRRIPANNYTGSFTSVKWLSGIAGTSQWIAFGDGGEVQISNNGGETWIRASTEKPNTKRDLDEQESHNQTIPADLLAKRFLGFNSIGQLSFSSYISSIARCNEKRDTVSVTLPEVTRIIGMGGTTNNEYAIYQKFISDGLFAFRIIDSVAPAGSSEKDLISNIYASYKTNTFVRAPLSETIKAFYGYGDGIDIDLSETPFAQRLNVPTTKGRCPSIQNFTLYNMYGPPSFAPINVHQVGIRGWKYGISNYQEKKCALYRYGRYGQFRDMLEQRPYTKFFDGTAMLESPVTVNFVSGTVDYERAIDYVTNTNPSYDPRDSGFWDYEYRSGQPFYDIDNID